MFRLLLLFLSLFLGLFAVDVEPAVARYASIVVNAETGKILHAENATTRNYPASLTKIMTLFMTFEALRSGKVKLDQRLPVSRIAAGRSPAKLGLRKGQTISVEDAISALVTKSANDVATVIAEALGGTERKFARQMTKRAHELGMKDTTFRNASGLPNREQLSTAKDMATLARAVLREFPREYKYFAKRSFTWNGRTYRNHNKLLDSYEGVDGIKTGYIRASGYNLVASAKRNGVRVIAVMFGGNSSRQRNRLVARMLDRGFTTMTAIAAARSDKPERVTAEAPAADIAEKIDPELKELVSAARSDKPEPASRKAAADRSEPTPTPKVKRPGLKQVASNIPDAGLRDVAREAGVMTRRPAQMNSWAIQVGAYNRFAPAHFAVTRAARAVPSLLGTRFAIVQQKSARRKGPDIYKARLLVNTESRAQRSCNALKRRKIDCMVIWMGRSDS